MRGPEEWPSRRSNPADRIRLTGPAATNLFSVETAQKQEYLHGLTRTHGRHRTWPADLLPGILESGHKVLLAFHRFASITRCVCKSDALSEMKWIARVAWRSES